MGFGPVLTIEVSFVACLDVNPSLFVSMILVSSLFETFVPTGSKVST